MSDRRSYIALDWVNQEIIETLNQAVEALDGFVCNSEDITKLRFSLSYVHQVSGSLRMIELHGASIFARDIEDLITSMLNKNFSSDKQDTVASLIKKALIQLSAYVIKVGKTHEDTPKDLLDIMNEVRAANKQERISEADVFNPNLKAAKDARSEQPNIAIADFNELIRKLRQTFQRGLIGVVRDQDLAANYLIISKVCASLNKVSANTASEPLWQIAYAIAEHLLHAGLPADIDSKKILKQIDNQIKHLEESGRDSLSQPPAADLLRLLLYGVATAEPVTDSIRKLRSIYQLDNIQSAQSDLAEKVIASLQKSINKDIAALLVYNTRQESLPLCRGLDRLVKTYDLLLVLDNVPSLSHVADKIKSRVLANEPMLSDINSVELALSECQDLTNSLPNLVVDKPIFVERYKQYIHECRSGLEVIKEKIVEYIAAQAEDTDIDGLPGLLDEQIHQLNISSFYILVPLINATKKYVEQKLLGSTAVPEWSILESLADILSAVDYYLECVIGDSEENLAAIVSMANESVLVLGVNDIENDIPILKVVDDVFIDIPVLDVPILQPVPTAPEENEISIIDEEDEGFVLGDDVDEDILEIFIEEGREVTEHILEYLPQLKKDYNDEESLLEIRRSFHTLKGSGRMVGAMHLGDFSWSVERMLNNVRDGIAKVTNNCIAIIEEATALLPDLMDALEQTKPISRKVINNIILKADAEWEGKPPLILDVIVKKQDAPKIAEQLQDVIDVEDDNAQETIDDELLDIFLAEAEIYISIFRKFLDEIDPGYEDVYVTSDLQRALHTLKGSAYMAGVIAMATLVTPLESFVKDLNNFQTKVDADILTLFVRASELLTAQLNLLKQRNMADVNGVSEFINELKALHANRIEIQEEKAEATEGLADKYTVLLSEALECMTGSADLITEWQTEGIDKEHQQKLVKYVSRLSDTATKANYPEVAALAAALAHYYQSSIDAQENFDNDFFELANKGHDELDDMMDIIAAQQVVESASELIAELNAGAHPAAVEVNTIHAVRTRDVIAENVHQAEFREQLLAADPDTREIFSEEAGELLEILDVLISDWIEDHADMESLGEIKRILHTIKGGARLTELSVLGDLAHAYENRIEDAEVANKFDQAFFDEISIFQDEVAKLIEYVVSGDFKQTIQKTTLDDNLIGITDTFEATVIPDIGLEETPIDEVELELELEETPIEEAELELELEETPIEEVELELELEETPIEEVELELELEETPIEEVELELGLEETPIEEVELELELEELPTADVDVVETLIPEGLVTASHTQQVQYAAMVALAQQYQVADADTLEIFLEEAEELTGSLEDIVNTWINDHHQLQNAAEIKRILHTIKGGARMTELASLGDLAHEFESVIEAAEATNRFDDTFFNNVQSYQDRMYQMVDFILAGAQLSNLPVVSTEQIVEADATIPVAEVSELFITDEIPSQQELSVQKDLKEELEEELIAIAPPHNIALLLLAEQCKNADQDTLEIFLEEAEELTAELEEAVLQWLDDAEKIEYAAEIKRILHTIKGGARMTELASLGDLAHDYESIIESAEAKKSFDNVFFESIQSYQDQVQQMVDFILSGAKLDDVPIAKSTTEEVLEVPSTILEVVVAEKSEEMVAAVTFSEDFDEELVQLFVEEAMEQLEGIEETIADFLKDSSCLDPLEELKRLLHTLKGGARLAGVKVIGDLSHDMETYIISCEREHKVNSGVFVDELQVYHDKLSKNINAIKASIESADKPKQEEKPALINNVIPIRPDIDPLGVSQAAIDATRTFIENFNKEQRRSNRDPVKIAPEQLETLINLAGENSIGHSRVEEQVSDLAFSQGEMDATIDRLHSQLRRLEIETEAQIVFRQEQVVSEGQENFDPLEMDRYTHMQQLSKSLIEAASDLDDIGSTITNKMRDLETLLVQQSRIHTELQENLMRCQMVPFSRMVPRLRRIVRQVAQELGKKIEFNVENAEGEMDRTILERMVAPLEHMLRNAVDHGVEMPDVRKKAGKNPQGTITLALSREGGEVVLLLKDDGAGVNINAVRKKAIERGLIGEAATLSDHEISQFILHAGFSTAEKVTQISGRGVGMDVVHSEIKQMGGSVDIHSVQGKGSEFIVRLPFTVSVNRALMVCIGNDTYAIPLNTIEGIVRVSPYELEAYYQPEAPMFEYAGQAYNLRYMGTLLRHGHTANLEGLTTPLPVVLIRSSDYTVAVQVDRLLGSKEVVVKSLGPQFGMVDGLSGATVLGDGSVVIILDMLALIRTDASKGLIETAAAIEAYEPEVEEKVTTVMVTDDSVTVRKVTSRFLERYGLNVILAKDGMDAVTQLQDMEASQLPDIMLLDIEMPRMDGFEVLSRVRHNEKLQHIPICMITSRTGEKHRERAISLGANRYLGKPFQESELIQIISELTGAQVQQA